jgi:hypothetical protein
MPRTAAVATLFEHPIGGLDIVEHRGILAGSYAEDHTASIGFAFTNNPDIRTAIIRASDGSPLIESSLADGVETTTYLGRLTIFGAPRDPNPRVVGDRSAMAELAARPESMLVQRMRDALDARGISRDLYAGARPPRRAPVVCTLAVGEHVVFATWSWWWTIGIDISSWDSPARYRIDDGQRAWESTVHGWRCVPAGWSSWSVKVTNLYSADVLGVDAVVL